MQWNGWTIRVVAEHGDYRMLVVARVARTPPDGFFPAVWLEDGPLFRWVHRSELAEPPPVIEYTPPPKPAEPESTLMRDRVEAEVSGRRLAIRCALVGGGNWTHEIDLANAYPMRLDRPTFRLVNITPIKMRDQPLWWRVVIAVDDNLPTFEAGFIPGKTGPEDQGMYRLAADLTALEQNVNIEIAGTSVAVTEESAEGFLLHHMDRHQVSRLAELGFTEAFDGYSERGVDHSWVTYDLMVSKRDPRLAFAGTWSKYQDWLVRTVAEVGDYRMVIVAGDKPPPGDFEIGWWFAGASAVRYAWIHRDELMKLSL
ncbi:MAG: hypothetical protein H0V17_34665 [Deltaproteobacteria bacterium]|nr:hypothetical protein [Deltaproteobacteria bacterium]